MSTHLAAGWSWDPVSDWRQMVAYAFMAHALAAGTAVAVTAGLTGWFMVLRRQTFAGHTLSLIAFPGAAGATLVGAPIGVGYFGFCLSGAAVIGLSGGGRGPRGWSGESAVIGTVQGFALACGFLFVALYKGFLSGVTSLLFGSFLGITRDQVLVLAAACAATIAALALIGRPLLFASVDRVVASSRGLPVRGLDVAYLVLLGGGAAAAAQVTGALLVLAPLVMPAAAAQRLAARPALSLVLTVVLGLVATWAGLVAAFFSTFPVGFTITTPAFAFYLAAWALHAWRSRR